MQVNQSFGSDFLNATKWGDPHAASLVNAIAAMPGTAPQFLATMIASILILGSFRELSQNFGMLPISEMRLQGK